MPEISFPEIDARQGDSITGADAAFFRERGVLLLQNVIAPEELQILRDESLALVRRAAASELDDPDFMYATHSITGTRVPFRIDYVTDKMRSARVLLGHPFILRSVAALAGASFIPTWESMVFKLAGAGAAVNWHRDAGPTLPHLPPVFFADFYLDDADRTTALRAIPGSQAWPRSEAMERIADLNKADRFDGDDMVVLPMKAGDVLFHNVHVLHGSPAATGALRRVLYFAFRSISVEKVTSPRMPDFIPAKQRVLQSCLQLRAAAPYVQDRVPFAYDPEPEWEPPALRDVDPELNYRIPHIEL